MPEVLLSGHHERIEQWRRERSRERGERARGARAASSGGGERTAATIAGGRSDAARADVRYHS